MDAQPLADAVADRRARVERRVRVLEDDLHPPPVGLQRGALERGDVRAVEDDRAGRRVDEPQQQPADGRLAAARLADEAERLAAPDLEAHAVDGLDLADRPLQDAARDREVLDQVRTSTSGALAGGGAGLGPARRAQVATTRDHARPPGMRSGVTPCRAPAAATPGGRLARPGRQPAGRVVVQPAADVVARADRQQRRVDLGGDRDVLLDPRRAARREPAALGQVDEVGDVARDDGQLVLDLADDRDRADQARVYGWRGSPEQRRDVGLLDDLAGVHDRDAVAHLGDHAEVVGDEDDRRAGLVAQVRA